MKKQIFTLFTLTITSICIAQTNFNQYSAGASLLNTYGNNTGGSAIINAMSNQGNTQGTRFMFNNWLKGTVVDTRGDVINNDSLQFNFDKQANNLLATYDKMNVISVPPSGLKDFTLTQNGKAYHFLKNNAIDSSRIVLALVENTGNYALYKYVKTEFIKSDFHTNGIIQSGNEFDEYLDHITYYLLQQGVPGYKVLDAKPKNFKSAFSDKTKLYDYMGQHIDETVDENYLIGLVNFMNQ